VLTISLDDSEIDIIVHALWVLREIRQGQDIDEIEALRMKMAELQSVPEAQPNASDT
jgi:hypothetical protein